MISDDDRAKMEKLPLWSKRLIDRLDADLEHYRLRLQAMTEEVNEGACPFTIEGLPGDGIDGRGVPGRAITYTPVGVRRDQRGTDPRVLSIRPGKHGGLEVSSAGGTVAITPNAGNVITLRGESR